MNIRKMLIIALLIIAAVITGILLIREKTPDTDITAKVTRVGLLFTGSKDDRNYCQSHFDALDSIKDEFNLEIICREHVPEDETSYTAIKELVEKEKCRIIIPSSYGYGEYALRAARQYPEVFFLHPMGTEKLNNYSSFAGRMYQARYLSGLVAGMRTLTGHIGYVAAFPYSEVIRGINAFTEGVRRVRPDAKVHVEYCDSWTDDDVAEEATRKLLASYPVDIISMHTNSIRPNIVADEAGIWSIGYNLDNSELFPDSCLTSCVWNWTPYYREQILNILTDKFYGSHVWIGMEDGIVELSGLTGNVTSGTKEVVEDARERLNSRIFDVFYGPITDNKGVLRIPAMGSMSDDEMYNRFDWYVEGVIVEE